MDSKIYQRRNYANLIAAKKSLFKVALIWICNCFFNFIFYTILCKKSLHCYTRSIELLKATKLLFFYYLIKLFNNKSALRGGKIIFTYDFLIRASASRSFKRSRIFRYELPKDILSKGQKNKGGGGAQRHGLKG